MLLTSGSKPTATSESPNARQCSPIPPLAPTSMMPTSPIGPTGGTTTAAATSERRRIMAERYHGSRTRAPDAFRRTEVRLRPSRRRCIDHDLLHDHTGIDHPNLQRVGAA